MILSTSQRKYASKVEKLQACCPAAAASQSRSHKALASPAGHATPNTSKPANSPARLQRLQQRISAHQAAAAHVDQHSRALQAG